MSYRLILTMAMTVQLLGCSDMARWVRQYTYPADFRYVQRDDVRTTMRQLAMHSRQLNELMLEDQAPEEHRREMIEHLRAMESEAEKLDQAGFSTNHPKVDMNLPKFRSDLKLAREGLEREPPNYLLAVLVRGTCLSCHGSK